MKNGIIIRKYEKKDLPSMITIWNEVVREGNAFPQEECLNPASGADFLEDRASAGSRRMKRGEHPGALHPAFNAVVASNIHARHLYERIGFHQLGIIPGGFRMKDGSFEDICPYYIEIR